MILVDFSQIQMMVFHGMCNAKVNDELFRHAILNTLRSYRSKFKDKYGELVLCMDGNGYDYWRKKEFIYYKAARKKSRVESDFDWVVIFTMFDLIRAELFANFPYKHVRVDRAEGDDIIAVLSRKYQAYEPVLIISSDKDFCQLQQFKNIDQYCPRKRKMLKERNPETFLHEHTMRGDVSDGIPNFLSDADTFVTDGKRQVAIPSKKLKQWITLPPHAFCDEKMLERYNENKKIIDLLNCIPEDLEEEIINVYDTVKTAPRMKIMNYMIKHKMKLLLECLQEF